MLPRDSERASGRANERAHERKSGRLKKGTHLDSRHRRPNAGANFPELMRGEFRVPPSPLQRDSPFCRLRESQCNLAPQRLLSAHFRGWQIRLNRRGPTVRAALVRARARSAPGGPGRPTSQPANRWASSSRCLRDANHLTLQLRPGSNKRPELRRSARVRIHIGARPLAERFSA